MTLRVQIKNKGNSDLISELSKKATLIKRTGIRVEKNGNMTAHLGCKEAYSSNQGLATFDIDNSLLDLLPNDSHIVFGKKRISVKQFKNG